MQARSRKIWNNLHDAATLDTPYHEDTVTQTLALHLNRHHPAENRVHVFKRATEGKNGSDFIWLFFDCSINRYFPVAVQAKRLYADGLYGAFKANQVRKIKQYALVAGAFPIYLTYNYPQLLFGQQILRFHWPPGRSIGRLDYQRDLGLLFFHADHVANIADGQLSSSKVSRIGFPMWMPFCGCFSSRSGDPLIDLWNGFVAQSEDTDNPVFGVRGTPPALRSWKTGEALPEGALEEEMRVNEIAIDDNFSPSFVIGTTIGNGG